MIRQFLCFTSVINMFIIYGLIKRALQDYGLVLGAFDQFSKLYGPLTLTATIALENIVRIFFAFLLMTLSGIFLLGLMNVHFFLATRNKTAVSNKLTGVRLIAGMTGFIIQWIILYPSPQSEQWRTDMRNIIATGTGVTYGHIITYDFTVVYTIYTIVVLGMSYYYGRTLPSEAKKEKISSESLCLA